MQGRNFFGVCSTNEQETEEYMGISREFLNDAFEKLLSVNTRGFQLCMLPYGTCLRVRTHG
jgi:hypothetical protein